VFLSIEIWVTQAQFPDGKLVALGEPESIAYVPTIVRVPPVIVVVLVCCAASVGVVDHCLYVGVPKGEFVSTE
jgi:hypothetical protein